MAPIDLGEANDIDVVDRLVSPIAGSRLVDIGCGKGDLARALARRGAGVVGVEPDPIQAAAHRAAVPVAGVTFAEASAEALPFESGTRHGAIFGKSLHHVPIAAMPRALAEAMRVLEPERGFLLVLEPAIGGDYSRVTRPFHDETAVRNAAQAALDKHAAPRFLSCASFVYRTTYRYDGFASFVDEIAGSTFNPYRRADVDTPKVRALFEEYRVENGYLIRDEMRAELFRGFHGKD